MTQKILIICGKKQAGKSTLASYIQGNLYKQYGAFYFRVLNGRLICDLSYSLTPELQDEVCKQFSFADPFKKILIETMGLRHDQCYGDNASKDTLTKYKWEDMPGLSATQYKGRTGLMTGRDCMKYIGTEMFRKMNDNIWTEAGFASCEKSGTRHAIFNDGRHPSEIDVGKSNGAKTIRLTRNPCPKDTHDSEIALDPDRYNWNNFDAIIRNDDLTELETFEKVKPYLIKWGWL